MRYNARRDLTDVRNFQSNNKSEKMRISLWTLLKIMISFLLGLLIGLHGAFTANHKSLQQQSSFQFDIKSKGDGWLGPSYLEQAMKSSSLNITSVSNPPKGYYAEVYRLFNEFNYSGNKYLSQFDVKSFISSLWTRFSSISHRQADKFRYKNIVEQTKKGHSKPIVLPDVKSIREESCPEIDEKNVDDVARTKQRNAKSIVYESFLTQSIGAQKCKNPSPVEDFICKAECAYHEPELERTAPILHVAPHSVDDILEHCRRRLSPILVWISQGRIRYLNCLRKKNEKGEWKEQPLTGPVTWSDASKLLFLVSCIVKLPENLVFGFDSHDFVLPVFHAPFDTFRYMRPLPGIVRFVGTTSHDSLLFPTSSHVVASAHCGIRSSRSWWLICHSQESQRDLIAWESRNKTLIWRGLPTGEIYTKHLWKSNQRAALVLNFGRENYTSKSIEGYDVGFVGHADVDDKELKEYLAKEWLLKPHISKTEHPLYRYLLHVDGNTASWGISHKLNSGSAVLRIESRRAYLEYFYVHLKPWVHYIPVSVDLADLHFIRNWLVDPNSKGDKIARKIARNAAELFDGRFRAQDIHCYVMRLLYTIAGAQTVGPSATEEYLKTNLDPEYYNNFIDVTFKVN